MPFEVHAVTKGPSHHFFGFHDLVQWNAKGDLMLALEVDDISHPPMAGEKARSGIIIPDEQEFVPIRETCAFNYPQGSRQQWLGDTDLFLCNDRVGDRWGLHIVDARDLKVIDTLPFPVYCHDPNTGDVYYINFSRLQLAGGYGYVGIPDPFAGEDIPCRCGIYKGNIRSGKYELFVSLCDIATVGEQKPKETGYPHYVTHLVLNPSKTRLAFLHRYWVGDGGIMTRLMTVGVDGSQLRLLAKGPLSHFDWLDDKTLMIWGRQELLLSKFREWRLFSAPVIRQAAKAAKKFVQLWRRSRSAMGKTQCRGCFLRITDSEVPTISPVGIGILTEDGHPMVCPADRRWIVIDTYPDPKGIRTLMLYNHVENRRIDIGSFKMLDARPDRRSLDLDQACEGVLKSILKDLPLDNYLFTRSGYHCDLHPRWRADGSEVAFDSIHEGTRQVYTVKVELESV